MKLYEYETTIHLVPDKGGAYVEFPYDVRSEFGKSEADTLKVTVQEK